MLNGGDMAIDYSKYNKPILSPRKCHDCGVETYNYWCEDCQKRRKAESKSFDDPAEYYHVWSPKVQLLNI